MSAQHTPGPWGMETVRTSCGFCHKVGPWPHTCCAGETMSVYIFDDYPSPPEGTDTMLANARLIAAAPDMFEALQEAEKHFGPFSEITINGQHDPDDVRVVAMIRAALAKALGHPVEAEK